MKYLETAYKGDNSELNILLLNDLHIGAPSSDISLLDKVIKFAKSNRENTRILLNGDYIEGITKQSKGNIYEQTMSPKEQINFLVEKLEPISDLIDAFTIGNHDWRIEQETSIDIVEMISRYLGLKDRYLGSEGIVSYTWNRVNYTVHMHHGTGGGSTVAAVENAMKKLWKSDATIMYCGHWHKEFNKPIKRYAIDTYNKKVRDEKRWMICGNTIVNTAEYAKRGGFEESYPSQAVLHLSGKKNNKNVDVSWIRS